MTDHAYGHILTSTPGSITRAVVGTDDVTIETFTRSEQVVLSWRAFAELAARIEEQMEPPKEPAGEPAIDVDALAAAVFPCRSTEAFQGDH